MAVGRKLTVNRPAQAQLLDDGRRPQIKHLFHRGFDGSLIRRACAEGVHADAHRLGHSDGVGKLHLTLLGQPRGHHILATQRAA